MKRVITIIATLLYIIAMFGQSDITTFLGIPVDGNKSEMRNKLIAKGFTLRNDLVQEFLEGEFNGTEVHVFIGTNNNKVYRIMLCDVNKRNESDIKIRFNKLVRQFERNQRYTTLDSYSIPEDENIGYEMRVHNKRYEAVFYQNPEKNKIDTVAINNQLHQEMLKYYTEEQLQNPTEEIKKTYKSVAYDIVMEKLSKKPVWFIISYNLGEYYITMFYDNEYNHADGEDL